METGALWCILFLKYFSKLLKIIPSFVEAQLSVELLLATMGGLYYTTYGVQGMITGIRNAVA